MKLRNVFTQNGIKKILITQLDNGRLAKVLYNDNSLFKAGLTWGSDPQSDEISSEELDSYIITVVKSKSKVTYLELTYVGDFSDDISEE